MMKSYTYRDRDAGSHGNGAVRDITRKIEEIMETVPKGGSLPSKRTHAPDRVPKRAFLPGAGRAQSGRRCDR